MQDCLIVVGMHRSGTSALAGALHRLGADFGPNLVEAQDDNVRGYYEHSRILSLHESLLAQRGSSWDDLAQRDWALEADLPSTAAFREELAGILAEDFAGSGLWAVKDPRLSHLLPLWLPVLANLGARPRVVVAARNPNEIAASLARRDGFSREKSGLLWLQHNLSAERTSRPFPRAFVDFGNLLHDPAATLTRAGRQLDLRWPVEPAAAGAELGSFLDRGLRHQRATENAPGEGWGRIGDIVPALVDALRRAGDEPSVRAPFEKIASEYTTSMAVDPLVLEHVHQFGRREVRREVWSASRALQERLASASQRLGGGLEQSERQLKKLAERLTGLEKELGRRSKAREDREVELDRTLSHLTEALATTERSLLHLESEGADLRAKIVRWSDEVAIEDRLTSLEAKLSRWSDEVDIEDKLMHLEARLSRWSDELATLEEKRVATEAALSYLDDRANRVEGRSAGLEERSASLDARVAALEWSWWRRLELRLRRLLGK
jgi:hypothetical protein